MRPVDFDYVRNFVRAQAAIVLEPGKEYLVESRLLVLARKENFKTIDELVQQLRNVTYPDTAYMMNTMAKFDFAANVNADDDFCFISWNTGNTLL